MGRNDKRKMKKPQKGHLAIGSKRTQRKKAHVTHPVPQVAAFSTAGNEMVTVYPAPIKYTDSFIANNPLDGKNPIRVDRASLFQHIEEFLNNNPPETKICFSAEVARPGIQLG